MMPRPYKIKEPYTTLNIVIPIAMKEELSKEAHSLSKNMVKKYLWVILLEIV